MHLNNEKFQFCEREGKFSGFLIGETTWKPLDKYVNSIKTFKTPENITYICSFHGLCEQVSQYYHIKNLLLPLKPLLKHKKKYEWNEELNEDFKLINLAIYNDIEKGIQMYDLKKNTILSTYFRENGLGYFLWQHHCK